MTTHQTALHQYKTSYPSKFSSFLKKVVNFPNSRALKRESLKRELLQLGMSPMRFMAVYTCYELGVFDLLDEAKTSEELQVELKLHNIDFVRQLLYYAVKAGLLEYNHKKDLFSIAECLTKEDIKENFLLFNLIRTTCYRQLYHFSESLKQGKPIGLHKVFGDYNNLYEASCDNAEIWDAWYPHMDATMRAIDPWFLNNFEIKEGSKILEIAGNTGKGAIALQKKNIDRQLHVTVLDLPLKERESLANFREAGMEDKCAFTGGDIFQGVPAGYDVIFLKHFLAMFSEEHVRKLFSNVAQAMTQKTEFTFLAVVYHDNIKDSFAFTDFAGFFIACSMGQGGFQSLATYIYWAEEAGLIVTKLCRKERYVMVTLKRASTA